MIAYMSGSEWEVELNKFDVGRVCLADWPTHRVLSRIKQAVYYT